MSIWTKTSSGWVEIGGGGSDGLEGLGTWAVISEVSGSPKRYAYNDGIDWVAFEWTQDGKINTSGGLVEALICGGGGQGTGGWISPGAYLLSGVEEISAGLLDVHVGAAGKADNTNGGASWVGNSAPYYLFANGGGGLGGPDTGPGQGPYASYPSSITGTERFFCAYGSSYADITYQEPGQGGHYQGGAAQQPGVVIVRVPAAQAAGVDPGTYNDVTVRSVAKEKVKEAVKSRKKTKK